LVPIAVDYDLSIGFEYLQEPPFLRTIQANPGLGDQLARQWLRVVLAFSGLT